MTLAAGNLRFCETLLQMASIHVSSHIDVFRRFAQILAPRVLISSSWMPLRNRSGAYVRQEFSHEKGAMVAHRWKRWPSSWTDANLKGV
jgi:hypothetical protein